MFYLSPAAVGYIIAAMITGLISLISLIIIKENKVSEFRQAWIDALITDFSATIAHVKALQTTLFLGGDDPVLVWEKARAEYIAANRAMSSIRIRLNPLETQSVNVFNLLDMLEGQISKTPIDLSNINEIVKKLIVEAHTLLKGEWTRVRRGERVFRYTCRVLFIGFIAGMIFLVGYIWKSLGNPI
jgi:hypothetical protein